MKKLLYLFILYFIFMSGCSNDDSTSRQALSDRLGTVAESIDKETSDQSLEGNNDLYYVERVVDGDTIVISYKNKSERVRFIGINTPESVHSDPSRNTPEGIIASQFTKDLLTDKYVEIELDVEERDKYGRILAYVYLDGEMVNKTLLKEGYAQVATYPPNVKYVDEFVELEREARDNQVGLWK